MSYNIRVYATIQSDVCKYVDMDMFLIDLTLLQCIRFQKNYNYSDALSCFIVVFIPF